MTSPTSPPVLVRPAVPGDAPACAHVHHTSWVETYSGLLPVDYWQSDTLERRVARWERWLQGELLATVAEVDGLVVGVAFGSASRQVGEHLPVRDRELWLLYVLASQHGAGVGQALLDAVVPPEEPAQLWVAERNPRARRFYERNGFAADGARYVDERLDLAEVRYVR